MIRLRCALLMVSAACSVGFGAVDPGLVALIPSDTQTVLNINAQEARGSEFGRFLLRDIRWNDTKVENLIAATGFDPRRDLVTLLVASNGTPQGSEAKQHGSFIALARGSFNTQKIAASALQHGATKETVAGLEMYLTGEAKSAAKAFSFLDIDVAVMGDAEAVRQVITNRTNATRLNPGLEHLIGKASGDRDVWFASVGLASQFWKMGGPNGPGQNARLLQAIEESSGGVKFGPNVDFSFDAVAKTDKDANSLADVVRFLASAAQVKKDQDANPGVIGPALDNLKLTTSGNELHVSTSLPEDALETLVARIQANHGRPRTIRN